MGWVVVLVVGLAGLLLLALVANSPGLRLPIFMLLVLAIICFFAMDPRAYELLNDAYYSLSSGR